MTRGLGPQEFEVQKATAKAVAFFFAERGSGRAWLARSLRIHRDHRAWFWRNISSGLGHVF